MEGFIFTIILIFGYIGYGWYKAYKKPRFNMPVPGHYCIASRPNGLEVHFSPNGKCELVCVQAIRSAKKSLHVLAYYLTDHPVIDALIDQAKNGIWIGLVADVHGGQSPLLEPFRKAGGKHWIDHKHAIMHNKVIVVDGEVVLTGSFNFTAHAEHNNAENLVVIRDKTIAAQYVENWKLHMSHAEVKE